MAHMRGVHKCVIHTSIYCTHVHNGADEGKYFCRHRHAVYTLNLLRKQTPGEALLTLTDEHH